VSLPLLLGESPSARGDRYHAFPLSGPPARVLCQLAGIPPVEGGTTYGRWTWALYDRFECRNLIERYADAAPWSAPRARDRAAEVLVELSGDVLVCLGRRVQAAVFGALEEQAPGFYEWRNVPLLGYVDGLEVVAVPHPSGLNRTLNDLAERDRASATLREALERASIRASA